MRMCVFCKAMFNPREEGKVIEISAMLEGIKEQPVCGNCLPCEDCGIVGCCKPCAVGEA